MMVGDRFKWRHGCRTHANVVEVINDRDCKILEGRGSGEVKPVGYYSFSDGNSGNWEFIGNFSKVIRAKSLYEKLHDH